MLKAGTKMHTQLLSVPACKKKGYKCIAFWRMGQEDVAVWDWIGNKKTGTDPLTVQIGIKALEEKEKEKN